MSGLLIGLTGGIAAGKSSVAEMFRDLGANLLDADKIAQEALRDWWEPTTDGRLAHILRMSAEEFSAGGVIDRRKLGKILFSNPILRRDVERVLHPLVAGRSQMLVDELRREQPNAHIIYESALLVEVDRHKWPDRLAVVVADDAVRIKRLMARNPLTEAEAMERFAAQLPQERKIELADFVIDNSGTPDETRAQVARIWENINAQAEARPQDG